MTNTNEPDDNGPSLADAIEISSFLSDHDSPDPEHDPCGEDAYCAEQMVIERLGVTFGDYRIIRRDQVPMTVVADMVTGWRKQDKNGNWTLDAVHWCARKRGKGNPAWWVATLDCKEDTFRVWRVSKGGGNDHSVTTEVARYRRKFEPVDLPAN